MAPLASSARSSSTRIGSSGRNRDVAVRGAAKLATIRRTTRQPKPRIFVAFVRFVAMKPFLEHMIERQDEVSASAAAERPLDPQEDAIDGPESKADAVVGLEPLERQLIELRRHHAGVVEDRAIDRGE